MDSDCPVLELELDDQAGMETVALIISKASILEREGELVACCSLDRYRVERLIDELIGLRNEMR